MLRSTSKFFFLFFRFCFSFGDLFLLSGIGESSEDIFFDWIFCEKGKTCSSGLGRHSDDVGNIFGLVMRSLEIYDNSEWMEGESGSWIGVCNCLGEVRMLHGYWCVLFKDSVL